MCWLPWQSRGESSTLTINTLTKSMDVCFLVVGTYQYRKCHHIYHQQVSYLIAVLTCTIYKLTFSYSSLFIMFTLVSKCLGQKPKSKISRVTVDNITFPVFSKVGENSLWNLIAPVNLIMWSKGGNIRQGQGWKFLTLSRGWSFGIHTVLSKCWKVRSSCSTAICLPYTFFFFKKLSLLL